MNTLTGLLRTRQLTEICNAHEHMLIDKGEKKMANQR